MKGFSIVFKIAFRNVFKYGRRSLGTFIVVFIGIAAMALTDAFMNGFGDRLVAEFAVSGGHLRVSAKGYSSRRATCPLDRVVADPKALAAAMGSAAKSSGGVAAISGRVVALPLLRAPCAIQLGERSVNLYAAGADAYLEDGLAPPYRASTIISGRYPGKDERGLVLSSKAAAKLGASVGDSLVTLANDAFGSFGAVELPLSGITRGEPGSEACFMDISTMRELLGIPTGASEVALYLVDASLSPLDPRGLGLELGAIEAAALAAGLEAEAWDAGSSAIPAMLSFFDYFAYALYAIFAAVAGAGVANSIFLSIQDRTKDFGTLRAVAFSSSWVRAIVALETLIIGTAASLAAAATSWAAIAAMGSGGLRVPEAIRGISEWMPASIAARVDPWGLALIVLAGCLFPLLASAYPLRTLRKMRIREALGYV